MTTTTSSTLDVRHTPLLQRPSVIFERLAALDAGNAMLLVTDRDPAPLRRQTDARWPGQFEYTALEAGPALWRMEVRRGAQRAAASAGSCCSGGACEG